MKYLSRKSICFILILGSVGMTGCVSGEKNLTQKVSGETQVQNRSDLRYEATDMIQTSKTLSPIQKTSLMALRDSTRKQLDELQSESIKLRSVLIKDVLAKKYNPSEVKGIRSRMTTNEKKKIAVIFETVDQANKIIGRNGLGGNEDVFTDFFMFDAVRAVH